MSRLRARGGAMWAGRGLIRVAVIAAALLMLGWLAVKTDRGLTPDLTPIPGAVVDYAGADNVAALQSRIAGDSRNQILMVMFEASWCGFCRRMTGHAQVAGNLTDYRYTVLRVNVERYPRLAESLQKLGGVPETHIYVDGEYVDMLGGSTRDARSFAAYVTRIGQDNGDRVFMR